MLYCNISEHTQRPRVRGCVLMGHVEKTKWYEWRMHLVSGNAYKLYLTICSIIFCHTQTCPYKNNPKCPKVPKSLQNTDSSFHKRKHKHMQQRNNQMYSFSNLQDKSLSQPAVRNLPHPDSFSSSPEAFKRFQTHLLAHRSLLHDSRQSWQTGFLQLNTHTIR